ncbi:MAG: FAD-dependent oxidoreductase [Burkholderiales bacterium]|nr:FAD-dependent oxidoreductase [Burkholderiales bacterium]
MLQFATQLVGAESVAEGTMAFHFARPEGFRFTAGNAVNLTLVDPPQTDGKGDTRTFSIVSAPSERTVTFATRMRDSAFKRVLKSAPMGTRARLGEPGGEFTLDPDDPRPAVFLAAGIGITPFVSMSRHAANERLARAIWLCYSNRRPEDAPFLDELLALERRNPNYRCIATMTAMEKSVRPWRGERGPVDQAMLRRHLGELSSAVYYIAGPAAMVEAMQQMLAAAGVGAHAVRTDEFYGY